MLKLPQLPPPLLGHHFADKLYVRECHIAEGSLVVGARQRKEHLVMLMSGSMTVLTKAGMETLEGPAIWKGEAGIKRVIIAHTDCLLCTLHHNPDNTTDETTIWKEHTNEDVLWHSCSPL
jgi:hypothetical protein